MSGMTVVTAVLPNGLERELKFADKDGVLYPKLEWGKLPEWMKRLGLLVPQLGINDNGEVTAVVNNYPNKNTEIGVPQLQSRHNSKNLEAAARGNTEVLMPGPPRGLVLQVINENEPPYTGETLVKNRLGNNFSVALAVGDAPVDSSDIKRPISILQAELPDQATGRWPIGAHAHFESRKTDGEDSNPYLVAAWQLARKYGLPEGWFTPEDGGDPVRRWPSLMTEMDQTIEENREGKAMPNKTTLGIALIGAEPERQKTANLLGVMSLLGRQYGIAGINILGSCELNRASGDPGARALFEARLLYAAAALVSGEQRFARAVFSPFDQAQFATDPVIDYFEFMAETYFLTGGFKNEEYFNNELDQIGFEEILKAVYAAQSDQPRPSSQKPHQWQ